MKQEEMGDLLLPAYQKLYAALQSLERFNKGQDTIFFISFYDISFDIPTESYPSVLCSICQRTKDWGNSSRAKSPASSYP